MKLLPDSRALVALLATAGLLVVGVPLSRAQDDGPAADARPGAGEGEADELPPVPTPTGPARPPIPIPDDGDDGPLPDPSKPAPPSRPPTKKPGDTTRPTKRLGDREQGELLYKRSCWQCHGERGLGDGPAATALVGGVPSLVGRIRSKDAERLEDQDALIRAIQEGKGRMPAYSEDIDKSDSRRILLYIRDVLEGKGAGPPRKEEPEEAADADGDAPGG